MGSKFIRAAVVACTMTTVAMSSPVQAQSRAQADLLDFRAGVQAALQEAQPDLDFTPDPADPARILSDTGFIDVTNAYDTALAFPEEPQEEIIASFVDAMLRVSPEFMDDLRLEETVAVLRSADYIDYLSQIGTPFISRQVTRDLHAIVMRNTPTMLTTVSAAMLPDTSEDEIFETGLANASRFLADLGSEDHDGFTLYFVENDPDLSNALALVPEFWDIVRSRFGDDFVFVMPRRDQLFVFDARRDDFMIDARTMVDITFADRYNLLSPGIHAVKDAKIITLETP